MADETTKAIDTAADNAISATEAVGEAAKEATATTVKTSKRATAAATRSTRRQAKTARAATAKKTVRRAKPRRTNRKVEAAARPAVNERINDVNTNTNNWFANFGATPNAVPFQAFFSDAGERGQDAVRRSQKAIEDFAELSRANVEAIVDAGKIAVEGARSLGQDVVETSREGVEQAADAVRALAEVKSPTEFAQVQGEFARASFDRFVAESSRLTESFVKLAGEAFQPLSTRATLNAERINQIVA